MIKKAIYLFALVAIMPSCNTHRNATVQNSLLVGTWEQPNLTLDLKSNGHYHYPENGHSNKQSGKYSYFADKDSEMFLDLAIGTALEEGQRAVTGQSTGL